MTAATTDLSGRFAVHTESEIAVSAVSLYKRFPVRRTWQELLRHPRRQQACEVIRNVSLAIYEGEFFGILGPNGAGKTTLFKMLMGALIPDAGTAEVLGHDVVGDPMAVRRLVGSVMANERALNWRLSALENMKLFAALQGIHGAAARAEIDQLLRVVDLRETKNQLVGTFSSGMRQRLIIARALLWHPRLLLLDEPTRSLDPISAREFRHFLRSELVERLGCTVVLATHSSEEALGLCDRLAVLDKGSLLAVGTATEIARRVSNQRYRLWTRSPDHPAIATLEARGRLLSPIVEAADVEGWACVTFEIPGSLDDASAIIDLLTAAGLRIARFEQVPLALSELLERVMQRRGER